MPELVTVDVSAACETLGAAADRVVTLLESANDPAAPIPGLDWTVGDLAVHLAVGVDAYVALAAGSTESPFDISDIQGGSLTRSNAAVIGTESERDLAVLAARFRKGIAELLSTCEGRRYDETVVWHGETVTVGAFLGIAAGEALVHGRDLARALASPWTISPVEARLVLSSVLPLLPHLVNRTATADVVAAYELRVRGGDAMILRFNRGVLTTEQPGGQIDCRISADPVALLLVSYGRISQWTPVVTGKMFAWGRKPWLGFRLTRYLVNPG